MARRHLTNLVLLLAAVVISGCGQETPSGPKASATARAPKPVTNGNPGASTAGGAPIMNHCKNIGAASAGWCERAYLDANPDVAHEVAKGVFASGYDHYLKAGKVEGRDGAPESWDEFGYLSANPDVAQEVERGRFTSGYHHFQQAGRAENRKGGVIAARR